MGSITAGYCGYKRIMIHTTSIYIFVTGPLFWASLLLFMCGSLYQVLGVIWTVFKKERFVLSYMSWGYGLRSISHWLIPFVAANWRRHPVFTIITFSFHLCLLILPFFLCGHIVMVEKSWGMSWWSLPDLTALLMAGTVVFCLLFFFIRRILARDVRFVTTPSDYLLLLLVAAPFISGFMAHFQWPGYPFWMILHVLSGEVLLASLPFTRLNHMLFFPFTRAYMGSEFGSVRHSKDW